jgi:hypothetical protein
MIQGFGSVPLKSRPTCPFSDAAMSMVVSEQVEARRLYYEAFEIAGRMRASWLRGAANAEFRL